MRPYEASRGSGLGQNRYGYIGQEGRKARSKEFKIQEAS